VSHRRASIRVVLFHDSTGTVGPSSHLPSSRHSKRYLTLHLGKKQPSADSTHEALITVPEQPPTPPTSTGLRIRHYAHLCLCLAPSLCPCRSEIGNSGGSDLNMRLGKLQMVFKHKNLLVVDCWGQRPGMQAVEEYLKERGTV